MSRDFHVRNHQHSAEEHSPPPLFIGAEVLYRILVSLTPLLEVFGSDKSSRHRIGCS